MSNKSINITVFLKADNNSKIIWLMNLSLNDTANDKSFNPF